MSKQNKKQTAARKIANIFGALGYLNVCFQWLWSFMPPLYLLVENDSFRRIVTPQPTSKPESTTSGFELPGFVEIIIIIVAIIFTLCITIYALYVVPRTIGRAGQKAVQRTADVAIPAITHHHKISKKERSRLRLRITWGIKGVTILLPMVIAFFIPSTLVGLEQVVYLTVCVIMMCLSAIPFIIQFAIMRVAKISSDKIW